MLDLAKAAQFGGMSGEPSIPGLSEPFGVEIEDEHFRRIHE